MGERRVSIHSGQGTASRAGRVFFAQLEEMAAQIHKVCNNDGKTISITELQDGEKEAVAELKKGLISSKNHYVTAALNVLREEVSSLQADIIKRDQQQGDTSTLKQTLAASVALVKDIESRSSDYNIRNADISGADTLEEIDQYVSYVKALPIKLAEQLVSLQPDSKENVLQRYQGELDRVGALKSSIGSPKLTRMVKPARSPAITLEKLKREISVGHKIKADLSKVKHQYYTSGIKLVEAERHKLLVKIVELGTNEDKTQYMEKLDQLDALISELESGLNDSSIQNIGLKKDFVQHLAMVKELPHTLGMKLCVLCTEPEAINEDAVLTRFHEEVKALSDGSSIVSTLREIEKETNDPVPNWEVKSDLFKIKNQYCASGIELVKTLREQIHAERVIEIKQGPMSFQSKIRLTQADELLNNLKERLDNADILNAGNEADLVRLLSDVKYFPDGLAEELKALSLSPDRLMEQFFEGVKRNSEHTSVLNAFQPLNKSIDEKTNDNESTQSYRALYDLQELHFNSAISVATEAAKAAAHRGDGVAQRRLSEVSTILKRQLKDIRNTLQLKGGGRNVSKAELKLTKKLPDALQKQLVASGLDKAHVKKAYRDVQLEQLNNSGWQLLENDFEHEWEEGGSKRKMTFYSRQEPASAMTYDIGESAEGVFITPYNEGEGVSSRDITNGKHATSLFRSSFKVNGREAFNGVRHGILDPYGEPSKALRAKGAQKKAEEALIMALASKPELYKQALNCGEGKGEPPRLLIASTSLVTTGFGSSKEEGMQKQQEKAFKVLLSKANNGVLELSVPGPDGPRTVKFSAKVSRFNLPVNFGGVGPLEKITSGRLTQRKMNTLAMSELFGKKGKSGGEVGQALLDIEKELDGFYLKQAQRAGKEKDEVIDKKINELHEKVTQIKELTVQIKKIYKAGSHHSQDDEDAYKLPARIAYLTYLIGGVPLYNCKSGKDRTGMLDAEVKFLIARTERDGKVPEPGPLNKADQELFSSILLNSENHGVQKMNTSAKGYKTEHVKSIDKRISDPWVREQVRGLSGAVGS